MNVVSSISINNKNTILLLTKYLHSRISKALGYLAHTTTDDHPSASCIRQAAHVVDEKVHARARRIPACVQAGGEKKNRV